MSEKYTSVTHETKPLNTLLVKPAGPDCNMSCAYCFYLEKSALFPEAGSHRMSEDLLEEMIRQFMSQTGPHASFGWQGGEPTLMGLSFFEKAVAFQEKYGRNQSVGNGLQTNGLLIDQKWAEFLARYNFLVGLSLDGPEHVHDRYRVLRNGSGSWSRVKDRAKLMLDTGVGVNALSVVNDYSVRFPEEIYFFHKELGLSYMQFIPIVEPLSAHKNELAPFTVPSDRYGSFLCKVFDLWMADFKEGIPTTSVRFFDSLFYIYVGLAPPECTLLEECGVYIVVEHNGEAYACDFYVDPRWKLGNLRENRLLDLLNSGLQREFGQRKRVLPPSCLECSWLKYCRGGCPKDRVVPQEGKRLNHLCPSFKMFFEHAHDRFKALAKDWKQREARAQEEGRRARRGSDKKPGRNDPCPCGSGLKFKRCCGG